MLQSYPTAFEYQKSLNLLMVCFTWCFNIGRSDDILDWEGVENRQLFCFFKV
jgi:hypothetical protein